MAADEAGEADEGALGGGPGQDFREGDFVGILKQGQECRFLLTGQVWVFDAGGDFVVDLQAAAVEVDRADPAQAVVADGGFAVVETGQVFIDLDRRLAAIR